MTVDELRDRMSLREYRQWQEFAIAEPFPAERIDLAGALVSTVTFNVNRGKSSPAKLDDFLLIRKGLEKLEKAQATPDDLEAAHLMNTMIAFGGKVA